MVALTSGASGSSSRLAARCLRVSAGAAVTGAVGVFTSSSTRMTVRRASSDVSRSVRAGRSSRSFLGEVVSFRVRGLRGLCGALPGCFVILSGGGTARGVLSGSVSADAVVTVNKALTLLALVAVPTTLGSAVVSKLRFGGCDSRFGGLGRPGSGLGRRGGGTPVVSVL